MAYQKYQAFRFSDDSLSMIAKMRDIIKGFVEQGFVLTVRQVYYQLVAHDAFPDERRWRWAGSKWVRDPQGTKNAEPNYKWMANLANEARLAGLIDWDAIEDRTRSFIRRQRWKSGKEILTNAGAGFHMDMWTNQEWRAFVIIEKEALVGVLANVCQQYDVPILAARGYPSGTVLREFAVQDIIPHMDAQRILIIHLGDHDPSGLDMTRDLESRIQMFAEDGGDVELKRIALNMRQIEERKPPPNPAKTTDSRFADYKRRWGEESWELDALPPSYLVELVEGEILNHVDGAAWKIRRKKVESIRRKLKKVAKEFKE